jgi:glucose-6-phosphate isomerase
LDFGKTAGKGRGKGMKEPLAPQTLNLGPYLPAVRERIRSLEERQFADRLWRKDPGLWKADPKNQEIIRNALGWLHGPEKMEKNLDDLSKFADEVRVAGFRHVVHMGMGGSSLAPLAFGMILPRPEDSLPLTVLDTTDAATILGIERKVPIGETLFIVASKSGTTAEPLAFGEYFYAKVREVKGAHAGENFVAITDPETPLVQLAKKRDFRRTFLSLADIGGRFSALSHFGLVPAALMGVNVGELLVRTRRIVRSCGPSVPISENPGVILGAVMGELALRGRDKITFLMPESMATLGLWLEQLLAESTGKEGTGVLPVTEEPLGTVSAYGEDRVFAYIYLKDEMDDSLERLVGDLQKAGQPVITIRMGDRMDLAQELFRWEIATATAGAILGINPFDQPNVQESKDNTNRLLAKVRQMGRLLESAPTLDEPSLHLYSYGAEPAENARELLKTFFTKTRPGDYIALQAYLTETPGITQALQTIRQRLREVLRVATTLGYGPRFLHSTGQFHKGGPNTGLFLQLTADDAEDAAIPDIPYTFGVLKRAQALGDLQALRKHRRRVIRVHLGPNALQGLATLARIVEAALGIP